MGLTLKTRDTTLPLPGCLPPPERSFPTLMLAAPLAARPLSFSGEPGFVCRYC